jgi:hypothetical protein
VSRAAGSRGIDWQTAVGVGHTGETLSYVEAFHDLLYIVGANLVMSAWFITIGCFTYAIKLT